MESFTTAACICIQSDFLSRAIDWDISHHYLQLINTRKYLKTDLIILIIRKYFMVQNKNKLFLWFIIMKW